jgi:hypothetical protein
MPFRKRKELKKPFLPLRQSGIKENHKTAKVPVENTIEPGSFLKALGLINKIQGF